MVENLIGNFKDLNEEQPVSLRMNYIDFILENQDYIDINGIFSNPNLTVELIEKYYVFFRDLIKKRTWVIYNYNDNNLSLLISTNPNVSIHYLFEKLRNQPIENSTEVFFTEQTVKHALKIKKITVEDYINLQTIPAYHTLFESNYLKNRFNQFLIDRLCYRVKLEEIEMYPEIFSHGGMQFHGSNLSNNPNITLEFIQNHPEIPWDYRVLCRHSALTIQDLYTLKEHTIKNVIIEDNELVPEEIEEWKYPEISCNPNLVWGEPLPEGIPHIEPNLVYCQVNFDTLDISTLDQQQITNLSWNKKLPLKLVIDNPNVGWDFSPIFQNGNYPIEELIKVPNVIVNSSALSHNPNVHWTDMKRFPQIHWNLQNMSWNHNNGSYIFHYQKTKITRWIKDKYYGYFYAMATWLAYEVKKSWWSPENKITSKLRESAFKVGKLKDWY